MFSTVSSALAVRLHRPSGLNMRRLVGAAALALAVIGPSAARADFVNGGFEAAAVPGNQPFSGWTVAYRCVCATAMCSANPPVGHPAPIIVNSAVFGTTTITTLPVLCGTQMAKINDIDGQCHETSISQSIDLVAADIDPDCGTATVEVCWIGVFDHPTNGGHTEAEQPYFSFALEHTILSTGTTAVVDSAAYPSIDATKSQSGWIAAGPGPSLGGNGGILYYRQHCTPLIVLDAHVGDTVKLTMTVRDCTKTAHGAMAFLDCARIVPALPSSLSKMLVPQQWNSTVTSTLGQEVGDFNCDGKCDLVDYLPAGSLRVLESTGSTFVVRNPAATVPTNWTRIYTGDFDGDGCTDVAGWDGTNLVFVWADSTTPATDFDPTQSVIPVPGGVGASGRFWVGDFDGDGRDDLVRLATPVVIEVLLATGIRSAPIDFFPDATPFWGIAGTLGASSFYICDFNSDGKCDLMESLPTGLHVHISTGSRFYPIAKWHTIGPPAGGWSVGDFDCDGQCEAIRRTGAGVLEMLNIVDPSATSGRSGTTVPYAVSLGVIAPGPFVVGDFDGDGQDDLSQVVPGTGVKVIRACVAACECMHVDIKACCDYPDRTRYVLKMTINNRTGGPIGEIVVSGGAGITFAPNSVILSPPLQHRRTRTIMVTASGLTVGTLSCITLRAFRDTISDVVVCTQSACFTPPPCDCMDVFSNEIYCRSDGSGSTCIDFTVTNASLVTTHFIRLQPAANFFPSVIPVVLAPGQSYTSSNCAVRIIPPGGGTLPAIFELLDAGSNLICDEPATLTLPMCPTVLGECCIRNIGIVPKTATDCAMMGGMWAGPGFSIHCPQGSGGVGGSNLVRQILPRTGTYVTINEEQRTFIAGRTGDPAADYTTTAASEIGWPMDRIDPASLLGSGVAILLSGEVGDAPGSPLGDVAIVNDDFGVAATVDFASAGASDITIIGEGLQSYKPVAISSPSIVMNMETSPDRMRTLVSEFPGTTHGFVLEFDELTTVQFEGRTFMDVCELRVLAGGSPPVSHLTTVGFRGVRQPVIALGLINSTNTPCPGDLTGDCMIGQADVNVFTSAFSETPQEADVNGDGVTDINDLATILAAFGTTCPCGVRSPAPCPGDANADGVVAFVDITTALNFWNTDYAPVTGFGDSNGDSVVSLLDVVSVLNNWGAICP